MHAEGDGDAEPGDGVKDGDTDVLFVAEAENETDGVVVLVTVTLPVTDGDGDCIGEDDAESVVWSCRCCTNPPSRSCSSAVQASAIVHETLSCKPVSMTGT